MIPLGSRRTRPGAALAALTWLLGTVVLPVRHLALHARPHDHEGGGIHYHFEEDAGHDHSSRDDDDDEPGGPPTVEAPHHHGHSHHGDGLAHFGVATGDGAAGAVTFVFANLPERVPDTFAVRCAIFSLEGEEPARGPPPA